MKKNLLLPSFINDAFVHLENWKCNRDNWDMFNCGQGIPKCITNSQKCNGYKDCTDGRDEISELCGEFTTFGTSFKLFSQIFLPDCAPYLAIQDQEEKAEFYHALISKSQFSLKAFTVFVKQVGLVNNKFYYKSKDGRLVIMYGGCGMWMVQSDEDRYGRAREVSSQIVQECCHMFYLHFRGKCVGIGRAIVMDQRCPTKYFHRYAIRTWWKKAGRNAKGFAITHITERGKPCLFTHKCEQNYN